jgi:hypothetical protein
MMRAFGKPAPLPYVDEDDLLDLAADLGAGTFPAADIYGWHKSLVEGFGREPVTKRRFGAALREAGWNDSSEYRGGRMVRCWLITRSWNRRGLERLAKLKADSEASTGQAT